MLIAVDGTGSAKWRKGNTNSFVRRFYEDCQIFPELKFFRDGPSSGLGLLSVDGVVDSAYDWWMEVAPGNPSEPIDLVGHSRGGLAVLCLAKRLREKHPRVTIRFMGLYDAVDRTLTTGLNGTVPDNVL